MSSSGEFGKSDRMDYWRESWEQHDIRFHQPVINRVLKNHLSSVDAKERIKNVFVPLCGKTLDMKWLADEGYTVVGVDAIKTAVEEFFTDHNLEWTEKEAPKMGPDCKLLESKDSKIRLYQGDIMLYNQSVEGQFDMVWDRAALVAINRDEIQRYVKVMEDILRPGGRMIFESLDYDVSIFEGKPNTPPPYPMYEAEIKSLFGPGFTVEFLEKAGFNLKGKDVHVTYYLIVKNT